MNRNLKKSKILIVDDISKNIQLAANILKTEGYNLSFAKNGKTAIERCSVVDFDLILLDVMMPDMDGFEVCEILKKDDKTKDIPIIFLTGKTDTESVIKGFEIGGVDYITKPFNGAELKIRVQTHINLRIEQQRNFDLLNNILPIKAINHLKENNKVPADKYENVAILFSDLKDFTETSSRIEPEEMLTELNDIFTSFDTIMEHHHCERIKTIGDAYMAVSGLCSTLSNENSTDNIVRAAIEMQFYLKNRKSLINKQWEMRIGINTGSVIGGIVGVKKYMYDIFGETVNIAARMEQFSKPGKINLSEKSYNIVKINYDFEKREIIKVKGVGMSQMYFLDI